MLQTLQVRKHKFVLSCFLFVCLRTAFDSAPEAVSFLVNHCGYSIKVQVTIANKKYKIKWHKL